MLAAGTSWAQAPGKTTIVNGAFVHNGRPFPMVLDAGTDTFTPQDYDTVMASKDGWGANTWWLQYNMLHMKSEAEGDFSGLTRALDFFGKTGMMVNLYVRAEYRDVPPWFYEKYNDYKMEDPTGKQVGSQICFQHEGFRRLIESYLRGVARTAKNKKALLMYSTYDEFGPRGWGCFCARCVRKYRDYLKAQYTELAALNRAWSASYNSWDQIDAPRTQSFDPNFGDWQRYRLSVQRDFGLLYYNTLKQEDPGHPRWIDINMDMFDYTWRWGVIWWKLTDIFDALNLGPESYDGNAAIRTAMNRAIRDNYGKAATWHLGFPRNDVNPRHELWSRLFDSGHSGLVWWYSYWDVLRGGRAWGAGEEPGSPVVGNWFAARELNHLAQYLGDLYVFSKPLRGEVGLFVSGITDLMRSLTSKLVLQSGDPFELAGLAQILRDLNIPYEAFGEDQLSQLKSFKTVFLGQFALATDQKTAAAFRDYVREGGTLVVTNYAFSADANGKEIVNPAFGLDEAWGSAGVPGDPLPDASIRTSSGLQVPSIGGVARRKMGTARVLASLPDGSPAITVNRYGRGQVLFIGTNAGEAYNTGFLLSKGQYRLKRGEVLDAEKYPGLVKRFEGWENYATLIGDFLREAGVASPAAATASGETDLTRKVRVSVQEHKSPETQTVNHLLVVTMEPVYNPAAVLGRSGPKSTARRVKDLSIRARVPAPEQVKAVYRIPPIGYKLGKIDAVPEKIPFKINRGEIQVTVADPSDAECLLVARDARPLVGVKSEAVSAKEGVPTPIVVTVDNAAGRAISGEVVFPPGFRAVVQGKDQGPGARFSGLPPGERYTAQFVLTAPTPIERNRTFTATVRYRRSDGRSGESASYPVTSRVDERIAWGWVQKVEAAMTEAATTPGTVHGKMYEQGLQKREFVYAAYNNGEFADVIRLSREMMDICERLKQQRTK